MRKTAASKKSIPPGSAAVNGQVIYQLERRPNSFRVDEQWQDLLIQDMGIKFEPPNIKDWWYEIIGAGHLLSIAHRGSQKGWQQEDYQALAKLAKKLENQCKRYTDFCQHTEQPAFALIPDLHVLHEWARVAAPKPKRGVGAPTKKNAQRAALFEFQKLFKVAFGSRYSVTGMSAGPFTKFVKGVMQRRWNVVLTDDGIRETLREKTAG